MASLVYFWSTHSIPGASIPARGYQLPQEGRETAAWLLSSICHIPPENVTSKVTKVTRKVTRYGFHYGIHYGLYYDILGPFDISLSNAVHGASAGSDIYISVQARLQRRAAYEHFSSVRVKISPEISQK